MDAKKNSLELKYKEIQEKLGAQVNIFFEDIQAIFPDMARSSLYWSVSKLVQEKYLKRVRNGVYELNESRGKSAVFLSEMARRVQSILNEEGFEYYISGMDVIVKFMQHVPENYPVIIFVEKVALKEILQTLKNSKIMTVESGELKEAYDDYFYKSEDPIVILYQTESFIYAENNIATTEKAFIDLFYAVTRNNYPLPLQELARAYNNMMRLGIIDQKTLVKASYKRNLQYDIRYIVESKYITEGATEFVRNMKREREE